MYNTRPLFNEDTKSNHKIGLTQKVNTLSVKNKNRISKFSNNRGVKGKSINMKNQKENINEKYNGNIIKDYDKSTNSNKYRTINVNEKKFIWQSYNPLLYNKKESEPKKEKKSTFLNNNYLMKKKKIKKKKKKKKYKQETRRKREKELREKEKEKAKMKKKKKRRKKKEKKKEKKKKKKKKRMKKKKKKRKIKQ